MRDREGGGAGAAPPPGLQNSSGTVPTCSSPALTPFSLPGASGFPCCSKASPEALLPSALCPALTLEPEEELNMGPNLKVADLESCSEDPEQQGYRIECLPRYMERLMQQDMSQWSVRSNSSYLSSTEEDQVYPDHRSIRVQTSKHLFRADKLIQASEHSLQRAISMQPRKKSMSETTSCSDQELQPPSPCLSSSNLSPGLSLAELINFATSLAMASSGKVDLPNLEHMIKDPKPEREEPTEELEKPLEAGEPQKAWKQGDENVPCPSFDFSKPGVKRATIEGEVNLLQPSTMSPRLQRAMNDSVPGTKKGSPLLLKIHFKLSSPTSPEK
uniref:Spermatogenesis associated 32 n=1 Tax=Equus asinus asinus TaxID=83772 RepID=A0A8C4LQP3_EQUAS